MLELVGCRAKRVADSRICIRVQTKMLSDILRIQRLSVHLMELDKIGNGHEADVGFSYLIPAARGLKDDRRIDPWIRLCLLKLGDDPRCIEVDHGRSETFLSVRRVVEKLLESHASVVT